MNQRPYFATFSMTYLMLSIAQHRKRGYALAVQISKYILTCNTIACFSFFLRYIILFFIFIQILEDFLKWLDEWEKRVEDNLIPRECFLTDSTAEGLRMTVRSTFDLANYLLRDKKYNYVLTGKINQDPLGVSIYLGQFYNLCDTHYHLMS